MLLAFLNDSASGVINAVVSRTEVIEHKIYGVSRKLSKDNIIKDNKAETTEDFAVRNMYLVPHRQVQAMKARYFEGGVAYQALTFACTKNMHDFHHCLESDPSLIGVFKNIEKYRQNQNELYLLQKVKEEEKQKRKEYIKCALVKGVNEKIAFVLTQIDKFKDIWSFELWQVGNEPIIGNDNYAKIRCILRNGASVRDVKKIKDKIQAELRDTIIIKELHDKGSFELIALFQPELAQYKQYLNDIVYDYNQDDKVYIGKSYTGDMAVDWKIVFKS